jgi:adhesin/invasin
MLAALACVACDKVPLTAPTGSTVTLIPSTTILPVNGTAEITATVLESSGTFVQNGTVVTFSTTLGTLDPAEARTKNGKATVRLYAGTRSGVATIRAASGSASTTSGEGSTNVEINIGGAAAGRVSLTANPTSVSAAGGTTTLTATVFDTGGNRLEGVPVSFSATAGTISASTVTSDSNGEARATLTTTRTSTVTARLGGTADGLSAQVEITAVAQPTVTVTPSPSAPFAGQIVTFSITATGADGTPIRTVSIDYGDGRVDTSGPTSSAQHVYASAGTYRITVTVEDTSGGKGSGTTTLVVAATPPPIVTLNASSQAITLGAIVNFTVTVTPQGGYTPIIQSVSWNFGDGNTATTNSTTRSHLYGSTGNFGASAVVRFTDGTSARGETAVQVR